MGLTTIQRYISLIDPLSLERRTLVAIQLLKEAGIDNNIINNIIEEHENNNNNNNNNNNVVDREDENELLISVCETKFRIQHMDQLEALKSIYTTMETVLQG